VCIRLGLPHAQLRGTVGVDHLGREALRQKGKAVVAHDALKEVYYESSKEAGRTATKKVVGLFGAYALRQPGGDCDEEARARTAAWTCWSRTRPPAAAT
jgi:hypothetical protein